MPNPVWPVTLPQKFPLGTMEENQDGRIRTEMDTGPPKMRRRFTATIKTYTLPPERFLFTEAQKTSLESFYDNTCQGGTLPFDWPEPYSGAGTLTLRFVLPLKWTSILPGENRRLRLPLTLELLP